MITTFAHVPGMMLMQSYNCRKNISRPFEDPTSIVSDNFKSENFCITFLLFFFLALLFRITKLYH